MKEPVVHVGILSAELIEFCLMTPYRIGSQFVIGHQSVCLRDNKIVWNGKSFDELQFDPEDYPASCFELTDVTIGVQFHWERKENQQFQGTLRFIREESKLTAVNLIRVEDYLVSVISSEMSATSSLELLKAHAVISRSWLLAQLEGRKKKALPVTSSKHISESATDSKGKDYKGDEWIKWYDREDHANFDVCADDHCQRYQGITKASSETVRRAIEETFGEVLMSEGAICDARFSKCCGGMTEEFGYCWENRSFPYLLRRRDWTQSSEEDLRMEAVAEKWIRTSPPAFCNTNDKQILRQVLNNFDQETVDFYRWKVEYTQSELSNLIEQNTGWGLGAICSLQPLERGVSGRICKLKIVGSLRTMIVGKELEIRRILSPTHLYSSAFVVDYGPLEQGVPASFSLLGAGWGHGVGLCQIGAALMSEQGYSYRQILQHYYADALLEQRYVPHRETDQNSDL